MDILLKSTVPFVASTRIAASEFTLSLPSELGASADTTPIPDANPFAYVIGESEMVFTAGSAFGE